MRGRRIKEIELEDDPRLNLYTLLALNGIKPTQKQRFFINNMENYDLVENILEIIKKS